MCKKVNELKDLVERLNRSLAEYECPERYELKVKSNKVTQYQLALCNNGGMKIGYFGHLRTWYSYTAISNYIEGICLALEWTLNY